MDFGVSKYFKKVSRITRRASVAPEIAENDDNIMYT